MSAHSELSPTDILRRLIEIPSVNPMGRDVDGPEFLEGRMSDWLVQYFGALGCQHERISIEPERGNVLARCDSPDATMTLLFDAHQDTVPVDGMTIAPFDPVVQNGRIHGRGATDVKGGMAAMLHAFGRLVRERPAGAANVVMSCTCDEESGTLGVTDLVRYWQETPGRSRLLASKPDGAVVAEPSSLDVIVAHRGVVRFRVKTTGRACHSSDPSGGENAIYRMARVLTCVQAYGDAFLTRVTPHPLCGGATLSVGRIGGGTSVNVVPDACWIEVDRRLVPGEEAEAAVRSLADYLSDQLDWDVEIERPWLISPPLADDNNGWLAAGVLERVAQVDGPHSALGVPFGTHASPIAAAGVPAIVFGPGSIAQAHTKDEYIEIDQLDKAAEVYYRLMCQPPRLDGRLASTTTG